VTRLGATPFALAEMEAVTRAVAGLTRADEPGENPSILSCHMN